MRARAEAQVVKGQPSINDQLNTMALALGEVKGFLEGLIQNGVADELGRLHDAKSATRSELFRTHLLSVLSIISSREVELTEEEEDRIVQAWQVVA